jgi:hypothetical protein
VALRVDYDNQARIKRQAELLGFPVLDPQGDLVEDRGPALASEGEF